MNWHQIRGKWRELKGRARETWGKLTHRDLARIAGERDQLIGKIQQLYGIAKDAAEKEVDEFGRKLKLKDFHLVVKRRIKRGAASFSAPRATAKRRALSRR